MRITFSVSLVQTDSIDHPKWWQWPTVLSLDAPLVAIVWQRYFATLDDVRLRWAETAVLGISIWLAYAADRWFEGWRVSADIIRTPRHRFYQRHRWSVAVVWLIAFGTDLALSFAFLTGRDLLAGALLLVPASLYVLSHQLLHREHPARLPKEFCVALLIAAGALVFVLPAPDTRPATIAGAGLLFTALCFANVALIGVWEREVDESHGQDSLARQFTAGPLIARTAPWLLAACAIAVLWPTSVVTPSTALCVAASAILLGSIDRLERQLGWRLARVLADFVLLTPLVPLVLRQMR